MSNDLLSQILGSALGGNAGSAGGLGGLGGGLGNVLGGVLGGGSQAGSLDDNAPLGGKGALLAMLLPLAIQLIQRNGGVGGLMDQFRQAGHGQQVASWLSTGENEPVDPQAVGQVFGMDELSQLSERLGVSSDQIAGGLAQILPQVVNQLSPAGEMQPDADDTLDSALSSLMKNFGR
jgi:uncharacterized protein YidB (DUF937 family)